MVPTEWSRWLLKTFGPILPHLRVTKDSICRLSRRQGLFGSPGGKLAAVQASGSGRVGFGRVDTKGISDTSRTRSKRKESRWPPIAPLLNRLNSSLVPGD